MTQAVTRCVECSLALTEDQVSSDRGECWICARDRRLAEGRKGASLNPSKGVEHYDSKLNPEAVRFIRAAHEFGDAMQSELADLFGVHRKTIWQVVHDRSWSHVEQDYKAAA